MGNITDQDIFELTKIALLEDVPKERSTMVSQILDNQIGYAKECMDDKSQKMNLECLNYAKQAMTKSIASELVGVQPMTGPVGLIYNMQVKDVEPREDEDPEIKRMSLEVVKTSVEARSRRFKASYAIEAMQDLNAYHGLSLEAELRSALSAEIANEIDNEIMNNLYGLGERNCEKHTTSTDIKELICTINKSAMDICRKTRRGAGNYMIVSPTVAEKLIDQDVIGVESKYDLASVHKIQPNEVIGHTYSVDKETGEKKEQMKIISQPIHMWEEQKDKILVGYKGGTEIDAGYMHCPYVPVMASAPVVDPNTFQPMVKFMTRYGNNLPDHDCEHNKGELDRLAGYYDVVTVTGLNKLDIE